MDNTTYDQLSVVPSSLGPAAGFLVQGASAVLQMYAGEIVGVEIPTSVELEVTETEPGLQGDRVSGGRKPATVETGIAVSVPLFINVGDRIKVDTRNGQYLTRV